MREQIRADRLARDVQREEYAVALEHPRHLGEGRIHVLEMLEETERDDDVDRRGPHAQLLGRGLDKIRLHSLRLEVLSCHSNRFARGVHQDAPAARLGQIERRRTPTGSNLEAEQPVGPHRQAPLDKGPVLAEDPLLLRGGGTPRIELPFSRIEPPPLFRKLVLQPGGRPSLHAHPARFTGSRYTLKRTL